MASGASRSPRALAMTDEEIEPGRTRPHTGRRLVSIVGLLIGLLVAATLAANLLVRHAAGPFMRAGPADVTAPVAIVLGASVHRDGTPSPQLEERLGAALVLIGAGRVERILVSGARNGAYDEAGPMRRWLIQHGVPATRILEDHAGYRTLDTMERAARVYGIHAAVICTQPFHLPRAVFLARRAGIEAVGWTPAPDAARVPFAVTVRESLATLIAVVDSFVLRRQPREPGGAREEPRGG